MALKRPSTNLRGAPTVARLVRRIRAYAKARGMSVARVSFLLLNGGGEVERIERGGDIGGRRIDRAHATLKRWEKKSSGPPS
jgi:hypothetical protein